VTQVRSLFFSLASISWLFIVSEIVGSFLGPGPKYFIDVWLRHHMSSVLSMAFIYAAFLKSTIHQYSSVRLFYLKITLKGVHDPFSYFYQDLAVIICNFQEFQVWLILHSFICLYFCFSWQSHEVLLWILASWNCVILWLPIW
jgi:hypothetical protein